MKNSLVILLFFIAGTAAGISGVIPEGLTGGDASHCALYALMFCVGISLGNDTTIHKIEKPHITPIPTNNDKHSDFLTAVVNSKPEPIQPQFIDFNKDLSKGKMKNGAEVLYKQNTTDDLFDLSLVFPVGRENSKQLQVAADYLDYVGTNTRSANDIKKAFYQLACDYSVSVSDDETRVSLSGLNENMPAALKLMGDYINHAFDAEGPQRCQGQPAHLLLSPATVWRIRSLHRLPQ